MNWYTVEVTLRPVEGDDWTRHLCAVDAVPGTLLFQDAEEPVLSFPVEAEEPFKAARFVEGVLSIVGLSAVSGEVKDLPPVDFDVEDDDDEAAGREPSDVVQRVVDWMYETPDVPGAHEQRELIH